MTEPKRTPEEALEECSQKLTQLKDKIFEEIEKRFGYFSDRGLEKIIIDDGGYYGKPGSLKKYEALKSKTPRQILKEVKHENTSD